VVRRGGAGPGKGSGGPWVRGRAPSLHAEDPEALALSRSTPATLDAHGGDGYGFT
jgi:hypothetical protein